MMITMSNDPINGPQRKAKQRFSLFLQGDARKSDIQHCGFQATINLDQNVSP